MKRMLLAVLALTIAGLLAFPSVASAQTGDPTVEGRGWLYAKGTGAVDIDMGGVLRMKVNGDVIITDHAGDLHFETRGGAPRSEAQAGTDIILDDYQGALRVRGTNFSVHVDGDVKLQAHGRGQAYLVGDGVYKTRRGEPTVWDGMVELGGAEVEPAA